MDDWDDMLEGYNGDLKHDMMLDYIIDDDEDNPIPRDRQQAVVQPAARSYGDGKPETLGEMITYTRLMIARQHWYIEDLEARMKELQLETRGLSAKRRERANVQIAKYRAEIKRSRQLLSVYTAQLSSLLNKRKRPNVVSIIVAACLIMLIVGLLLFL